MPMSIPDIYSRAESELSGGAYPNWTIQAARLLVESVRRDDGDGGERSTYRRH